MPGDCTFTQGIPYHAFILGNIRSNPRDKKRIHCYPQLSSVIELTLRRLERAERRKSPLPSNSRPEAIPCGHYHFLHSSHGSLLSRKGKLKKGRLGGRDVIGANQIQTTDTKKSLSSNKMKVLELYSRAPQSSGRLRL